MDCTKKHNQKNAKKEKRCGRERDATPGRTRRGRPEVEGKYVNLIKVLRCISKISTDADVLKHLITKQVDLHLKQVKMIATWS